MQEGNSPGGQGCHMVEEQPLRPNNIVGSIYTRHIY